MKLHSYVVTDDTGFSPNPFWGYCTLANCKPAIRRSAHAGDWIAGISPKSNGNKLIYAMRVDEIISYIEYYEDSRFTAKIPDYDKGTVVYKCGDNIYKPLSNENFLQLQSMHSNGKNENPDTKIHDLGGKRVLISKNFYYFGQKALNLPETLEELKVGRAHKNKFSPDVVSAFLDFIGRQTRGVNAPPSSWPLNDDSWKSV